MSIYIAIKKNNPNIYCVTKTEMETMIVSGKYKQTSFIKLTKDEIISLSLNIDRKKIKLNRGVCPSDKERGPKTGNCVKKCKITQERNIATGRCRVSSGKLKIRNNNNRSRTSNLQDIYLNSSERRILSQNIKSGLTKVHKLPFGKQCIISKGKNQLSDYLTVGKLLGTGDWGNVYSGCIPEILGNTKCSDTDNLRFAIKISRIKPKDLINPYSHDYSAWHEVIIMKNILTPIVENNICPNVPLLMDSFICDNCSFTLRDKAQEHPCVIMVTELAAGDFEQFTEKTSPSTKELYSSLFQIMAGLHAVQSFGQVMNYDLKSANILYLKVTPGGYWHYVIHGVDFYVPNYGKLFILNDFGVSQTFSPDFQIVLSPKEKTFELGSRFAMDIEGVFSPIKTSPEYSEKVKWVGKNGKTTSFTSSEYFIDRSTQKILDSGTLLTDIQIDYLKKHNLSINPFDKSYFLQPLVIPPMEYYNDTQDVIRMFIGGNRTTQRGDHSSPKVVSLEIYKKMIPYKGSSKNADNRIFSLNTSQTLAGRFIENFFTNQVDYTIKIKSKELGHYRMSNY
jgi:hypothetical protein